MQMPSVLWHGLFDFIWHKERSIWPGKPQLQQSPKDCLKTVRNHRFTLLNLENGIKIVVHLCATCHFFHNNNINMHLSWHDSRTSLQYIEEWKITHAISNTVQTIRTQSYIAVQFNIYICEHMWRQVPTVALWNTAYGHIRQTGKVTG